MRRISEKKDKENIRRKERWWRKKGEGKKREITLKRKRKYV